MKKALPFFLLGMMIPLSHAHAGEALNQRMRAAQQQKALYQQQLQQRALQQQVLEQRQQQVVQQTVVQQQAALRQAALAQQQAAYQATLQQYQNQVMQQQQQVYQQISQNQTEQAVNQIAYQQAVQQAAYNQAMGSQNYQMQKAQSAAFENIFGPAPVAETSTMADVWRALEQTSHVWPQIMDKDAKELIVVKFLEDLRNEGVYIRKSAMHYVEFIDTMSYENPSLLDNSFKNILSIVAVMEYDFDNGVGADQMARKILGEQAYRNNLQRLGR